MKLFTLLTFILCSTFVFTQSSVVNIQKEQPDDTYLAGETIKISAPIKGDLIVAGKEIEIGAAIYGDLTAAGGSIVINKNISDDVRLAGGRIVVNSEIEDDLLVVGGEVIIGESAIIKGNLISITNDIKVNGRIEGSMDVKGDNVNFNGEILQTSKIVSDNIQIGSDAKFFKNVNYWSNDDQLDFGQSLVASEAIYNQDLKDEKSAFSMLAFGITSLRAWIFYVLSVFFAILGLHSLFRSSFSEAVEDLEDNYFKSFAYGLIYLLGIPLIIAIAFLMGLGVPLGLLVTGVFIFSVLIGHFISSLVIVYFIKHKRESNWNFWVITLLALLVTIILRLLTNIPFLGILMAVVVICITYGALTVKAIHDRRMSAKN